MKIMLIANSSWYLYNFRKNLILKLVNLGYDVICCAPYDTFTSKFTGLGASFEKMYLSPRSTNILKEIYAIFILYRILHSVSPDVLLSFTPKGNIYPALVKPKHTRQIVNISGLGEGFSKNNIIKHILKTLFKITLTNSELVLFQNQENMQTFIDDRIVVKEKALRIMGSGVDLQTFKPVNDEKKFKSNKKKFLTHGRILSQKGFPIILDMIKKYPVILELAEFHMFGIPDNNRIDSKQLYEQLFKATVDNFIVLHEPHDEVASIINQFDCVLLPSTYREGVPRALIEGLACGLPIITTDWNGCRDTVNVNKNGFLVQPNSIEDLYEKVTAFCKLQYEDLMSFSCQSRILAERLFDENDIINIYSTEIENGNLNLEFSTDNLKISGYYCENRG